MQRVCTLRRLSVPWWRVRTRCAVSAVVAAPLPSSSSSLPSLCHCVHASARQTSLCTPARCSSSHTAAAAPSPSASATTTTTTATSTASSSSSADAAAAATTTAAEGVPVHPSLMHELHAAVHAAVVRAHASGDVASLLTWQPIGVLYSALSQATRRMHIRPHKSFALLLQRVQCDVGIELDTSGVRYRIVVDSPEVTEMAVAATAATTTTSESDNGNNSSKKDGDTVHKDAQTDKPRVTFVTLSSSGSKKKKNKSNDNNNTSATTTTTTTTKDKAKTTAATATPSATAATATATAAATSSDPLLSLMPSGTQATPIDVYYDVQLTDDIPPPPPDFDVTPSSRPLAHASADGTVLSLATFAHYIPSFFVPLPALLATMPGYTEAHMDRYFDTSVIELVRVGATRYIRLYGGMARVRLCGHEHVAQRFAAYAPKVALVEAFVRAFAGVYETWMPLRRLLARVPAATVAQLPFRGAGAIVYFAQMQHVFAFSVNAEATAAAAAAAAAVGAGEGDEEGDEEGGGGAATSSSSSSVSSCGGGIVDKDAAEERFMDACAVSLRKPGYNSLDILTTPLPVACSFVLHELPEDMKLDVHVLEQRMPDELRATVVQYFGSIVAFLRAHTPLFHLTEDAAVVMQRRYYDRMALAACTLEEQLAVALEQRDRARVQRLRRRIAMRDTPSHPLLDRDNLARELSHYLPPHGFVNMRLFLRKQIPEEMNCFLPTRLHTFFTAYPQYFQHFEFQKAGVWCLSRPGEPLPRGVVRDAFSEDDVVRLIAAYLQPRGSASCWQIYTSLPFGAQAQVRRRHGGLYYLVTKYVQYFNVVLPTESANAMTHAIVYLVQLPPATAAAAATATTATTATANATGGKAADKRKDDNDDDGEGDDDEEEQEEEDDA